MIVLLPLGVILALAAIVCCLIEADARRGHALAAAKAFGEARVQRKVEAAKLARKLIRMRAKERF